ncbi:MAG: hypothetical protein KDC95_01415 [Planctomycetes bacterium]|nr:hypothetical protein [Planctomycetota bacterium]
MSELAGVAWKVGIDGVTALMLGLIGLVGLALALVHESGGPSESEGETMSSPYPWGAASLAMTGAVTCVIAREMALGAMGLLASVGALRFLVGPLDTRHSWRCGIKAVAPVMLAVAYSIAMLAGDEPSSHAEIDASRLLMFASPVAPLPVVLAFAIGRDGGHVDRSRLLTYGIMIPTSQLALARTMAHFDVSPDFAASISRVGAIGGVACVVAFGVLAWMRSSPVWRLSSVVAAQTGFVIAACVPTVSGMIDVSADSTATSDVHGETVQCVLLIVAQAASSCLLTVALTTGGRTRLGSWLMALGCFAVAGIPGTMAAIPRIAAILRNRAVDLPIGDGVPFTVIAFAGVAALQIALGLLFIGTMRRRRERTESFEKAAPSRTLPGVPLAALLLAATVVVFGLCPSILHAVGMRIR